MIAEVLVTVTSTIGQYVSNQPSAISNWFYRVIVKVPPVIGPSHVSVPV